MLNFLNTFITTVQLLFFLKIGYLLLVGSYIIFLFVAAIQIISMDKIVTEATSSVVLKIFVVLQILFALSLFFIGLVIL